MVFDPSKVDLGSLSQVSPDEPIDDTLDDTLDDNLNFNMSEAVKINPDQHAKELDLSTQSGVPLVGVQSDPAAVEQDIKKSQFNFSEMRESHPVTANQFNDIDNAIIAQDDVDVMQLIEDGLKTVRDYGEDVAESFGKGQLVVESSEIGLSRMYQALGANEIVTDEQITRVNEIEELLKQSTDDYGFFIGSPVVAAEQLPIMFEILRTGAGYAATGGVGAGVVGLVTGPGAIPLGITGAKIGGRVGVAKAAFDLEAGLAFNEFSTLKDDKGNFINPQIAGGAAAIVGSINAGLEFISLAALGRTVTPVMRNVIKSKVKKALGTETGRQMMTRLMKDYGIAVATEAVTESAQEFTNVIGGELAKYIDEDSFTEQDLSTALDNIFSEETGQRILEAGEKGAQASLIFAGAGTTASVISETRQRERLSESEQLRIDTLNESVGKSKLKERNKESFKQFVNEADGENNTHVFIDGSQVSLYLQTKTPEEIETDPALKLLSEQAAEAAALDSDVQVPVADFAAEIAGTDHYEQLRDSMTLSDESVSPFRQEQVKQETDNYIKTLMSEAQENTSEFVEAQEIYSSIRDQLIDTGQVNASNASVMAQVVPAWATAKAKRDGKTVAQVYQEQGFTIEGPQTGERARLEGEQVLEQGAVFTSEESVYPIAPRSEWFGDADFVQRGGQIVMMNPQEYLDSVAPLKDDELTLENIQDLQTHIEEGNQLDPLVIYETGKEDGRHRARAAINLSIDEVPVILFGEQINKFPDAEQFVDTAEVLKQPLPESLKRQAGLADEDIVDTDVTPEMLKRQSGAGENLFVAHNLSAENIIAAEDLGGLAAPSLATLRADISDFTGFGEVTLLADPSLLDDPKARTFDADIYSPRQPRPVYDINFKAYRAFERQLDPDNLGLSTPDIQSLEDTTGADNFQRSAAVEYHWLQSQGKAPKLKNAKVDPVIRKAAKLDLNASSLKIDEKFIKMATDHYRGVLTELTEKGFDVRAEKMKGWYFEENGSLKHDKLNDLASGVQRFRDTSGKDVHQLRDDIAKKMRVKKIRDEYDQWAADKFNSMVVGKKLFKGFTPSGNRKYVDYNMQNVVKDMTQQLQAGETFFYGAGTVRSKYAKEMKTIKQIQAKRDEIVSEEDMQKIKDESSNVFMQALDDLKPFYKFEAGSWGYADDAGNAIIEGRRGMNEAFNMTEEAQQIVDDLLEYLVALPTSYFETKIQRAVGFEEFDTAVVPRGMRKDALQILKDAGLKIKTYNPKTEGSRAEVIAKQQKLLFQRTDGKETARGYYDPANSIIRLTEAADLSTFLHEFAHFMYEMEVQGNTDMLQSINNWYKRNADEVAKEANSYLGDKFDVLRQAAFHGTPHKFDKFSLDAIGTGEGAQAFGWGLYFAENVEVAEGYKSAMEGRNIDVVRFAEELGINKPSASIRGDIVRHALGDKSVERAAKHVQFGNIPARDIPLSNIESLIKKVRDSEGAIYEVDIPDEHTTNFLDWDAPLNEQHASDVKDIFDDVVNRETDFHRASSLSRELEAFDFDNATGEDVYRKLSEIHGRTLRNMITKEDVFVSDREAASESLNSIGIKGIKYFDQVSRGEGEGTHNLVVFDEDIITIKTINGEPATKKKIELFAQPTTPPKAKEGSITADDVVTFLDTNTTGDVSKDAAIRRAVHEQFARGFETYLMEGKAPSIELRNAFRTFARWLSRIYQQLRNKLNVNIDEEMREVFDRLLATEEQIQAAQARARVEPMFTDAAMAGMTEEEFADYQTRQEKVKDVQSETLRDKIIKQLTRQTKTWWKEEKQDIVDEELESLSKEQVYKARDRLKAVVSTKTQDEQIAELNKRSAEVDDRLVELEKENDTVGQYIAKEGGLNREAFVAEGVDKDHFKDKMKVFGKPLFPRKGGMTPDNLAENLNEINYQGGDLSANDALDIVFDMLQDDTNFIDIDASSEAEGLSREQDAIEIEKADVQREAEQLTIKLDHAAVKAMVGEEKTDKRGRKSVIVPPELRGMTAKGMQGVHPDEAAAFFGYGSGSEMLIDLVTAPKLKDKAAVNADAEMVDRHGDILTDGTIEREADEAVRDEERGKLILHELKMLARGTNAPTIDRATIKALAEERVGRLSFREIHPGKYRKAEIRAAQESARMLVEGNREGAAAAKMRQVLNYYLGMAATNAKNETAKIVDRMARYNKKKVRESILKAEGGYWDQIVKILERFEFRKSATLKDVDSINLWAKERMESDGDGLVLSNAVLNESYITHWKNVPFADLQGINDSVKNIEHVARYANKMTTMQEDIDFKKLKANWVDHINEQDARFATKESRSRIDDSRKATAAEHIRRWASQLTKIPFLASWLDGGERVGMSHDILVQPFTDALDAKMKMVDEVATPVIQSILNRSKEDIKRHNTKIFIPEIDDNLMGHQVLAVALNTGNKGNLKKLLLGEGWADPENEVDITFDNAKLQAVLAHMTKSDWLLVQQIWDQMDSLYPQLAEVHRRTTGLTPPKVEATPINNEFGTFRGGYYPVKYSPRRSHKAEKNAEKREAETESMFNNTASIQASVNAGATNERTGFYDRIYLSLEVIPDHFNETIHYITHHDAVRQINRLIQAPDVASAITGVMGEAEFKELKPWLNDIAKDGRQQPVKTYIDEAFGRLRFGVTLGVMGFKATTGIMQLFGIFTTAAEIGLGPTITGVQTVVGRAWYMRTVRKLLGSREDMQSGWDFANERSKVLPHRVKTMDREIRNAMNRLSKKTGPLAAVQEVSMKHIALIQVYMVDLPTWHAAYDKHLSENGDEVKAVQFADLTLENTQGSGATKDMARVMRNQSKLLTTFTMFMTFFSSLGNLTRDLLRGSKSGLYSPTSTAAKTMFLFTLPVFFEMLMRGELDEPEDDDERLNKFLMNSALYPLTSVPGLRDAASGFFGDYGYNMTPVAAVLDRGLSSGKLAVKNIIVDGEIPTLSQTKSITKLVGAGIGIPGVNQMWSTGEHLYDVIEEGEEFTTRELLFGPDRE